MTEEMIEPELMEEAMTPSEMLQTPADRAAFEAGRCHNMAKKSATESIAWAIKAGAALLQLKESCGRDFTERVKALPFSYRTACNYSALTRAIIERSPELAAALQGNCDIRALTPFVQEAANGSTLTQLYQDMGIIKKPRPIGGNPDLMAWFQQNPDMSNKYPTATRADHLEPADRKIYDQWLAALEAERKKNSQDLTPEEMAREDAHQDWHAAYQQMQPVMARSYVDLSSQDLIDMVEHLKVWLDAAKNEVLNRKQ